jgi:hypothetical protein
MEISENETFSGIELVRAKIEISFIEQIRIFILLFQISSDKSMDLENKFPI